MEVTYAQKIEQIKKWLGTGSINIFGLPMSGKDTVGMRLASALGGKFLSSGAIIREMEVQQRKSLSAGGELINTDVFYDWVLPYFDKEELKPFPLVLSSIGRWSGEEDTIMDRARTSGHEIKAAVVLNVSETDVMNRWETAKELGDRGDRADDLELTVFQKRLDEFREKTRPVLLRYRELGLLVEVRADMKKEEVFDETVEQLYRYSLSDTSDN